MVCFEKFPVLTKFLCCINLESGCILLGLLNLLVAWTVFLGLALLEFKFDDTQYGNDKVKIMSFISDNLVEFSMISRFRDSIDCTDYSNPPDSDCFSSTFAHFWNGQSK